MFESGKGLQGRWPVWAAIAAGAILLLAGCAVHNEPDDFEFHDHRFVLRTRSINQAADTSKVTLLSLPIRNADYWRRAFSSSRLDDWITILPNTLPIEVIRPDTAFVTCTTMVRHYTGYQLKYGGDTTRLSCLDNDTSWTMALVAGHPEVELLSGNPATLSTGFLYSLPDTVRGQQDIRLDITFDMDGLLTVESVPINMRLVTMRSEKIYYHEW